MSTLDTLIQHLKELREKAGKDIPLYLVDADDTESYVPSEFKDWFRVGRLSHPDNYRDDMTRPEGLLLQIPE